METRAEDPTEKGISQKKNKTFTTTTLEKRNKLDFFFFLAIKDGKHETL
jgi:hypothetical protein